MKLAIRVELGWVWRGWWVSSFGSLQKPRWSSLWAITLCPGNRQKAVQLSEGADEKNKIFTLSRIETAQILVMVLKCWQTHFCIVKTYFFLNAKYNFREFRFLPSLPSYILNSSWGRAGNKEVFLKGILKGLGHWSLMRCSELSNKSTEPRTLG